MDNGSFYDRDYFESGLATGKSCYENYRWIPELTIPMAMTIIDHLDIRRNQTVLDFGCSKGYLVKAFRMLYRQAWGVDVSKYALENADPEAKKYCALVDGAFSSARPLSKSSKMPSFFDYCIAKDVFEHIPENTLRNILMNIPASRMLAVVPLGDGTKYNIPAMHLDSSHIHMEPKQWWRDLFESSGWITSKISCKMYGIKDNWSDYDEGHGFFTLLSRIWRKEERR